MHTQYLDASQPKDLETAARLLKKGGLVAIPTETVYGLAANALDANAVEKIFAAKGRPMDNPLIVHIGALSQLSSLVREIPEAAQKCAQAFWPGPLTMILPKADCIPPPVSAGLSTVAIRFPANPAACALIRLAGVPLAAPSANTSGRPSPTTAQHVLRDLNGKIDAVCDGGPCGVGLESTVLSLTGQTPRLLRPGGVTLEQLRSVLGTVSMDPAVLNPLGDGEKAASPGMKYKHYSPQANVIILKGDLCAFANYVNAHCEDGVAALCYTGEESRLKVPAVCYGKKEDPSEQAQRLFEALRSLDEMNARVVYARCPKPEGMGLAVYNRLIRAAGFEVRELG